MARSPNYPAISLGEAIEKIELLYEKHQRREMTDLEAVEAFGYGGLHGASRRVLASLKHYGLVDDRPRGVAVSDRALAILLPASDDEKQRALREALYAPRVFQEVLEEFDEIPSPGRLKAHLVRQMSFVESAADTFDEVFRSSVALAQHARIANDDRDDEGVIGGGQGSKSQGNVARHDVTGTETEDLLEYTISLSKSKKARLTIQGELAETDMWILRGFFTNSMMAVLNSIAANFEDPDRARALREAIINDLTRDGPADQTGSGA